MTLQPLCHIHSHCKACVVVAVAGVSGLCLLCRHCYVAGDSELFFTIVALAQLELRLRHLVGGHPSLDVLSSLDYFVAMLCHCMLGDLSVTSFKSMCRRHPCSRRVVSWDFFLSESCYASVCWATYL
jgi:hypothetical protein